MCQPTGNPVSTFSPHHPIPKGRIFAAAKIIMQLARVTLIMMEVKLELWYIERVKLWLEL